MIKGKFCINCQYFIATDYKTLTGVCTNIHTEVPDRLYFDNNFDCEYFKDRSENNGK